MRRVLPLFAVSLVSCLEPATEGPPIPGETDKAVLEGELCAAPAVGRPLKLVFALDASQSLSVTDPNGTRAAALTALLNALPQSADVSIAVMMFAGSTSGWILDGLPQFKRVDAVTASDRATLAERVLNFTSPGTSSGTDFVQPLANIRALIERDISNAQLEGAAPALYSILFVSDGSPTNNQDDILLCGDTITALRALGTFTADVRLSTAFVFSPPVDPTTCAAPPVSGSSCRFPVFPPGTCAAQIVDADMQRLERMATLGGGEFRAFLAGAPVDFGFFAQRLSPVFSLGTVVATNLSAAPGTGEPDSDEDGLPDALEQTLGTDPAQRDSDSDGFSDGIERWAEAGREVDPSRLARMAIGCAKPAADSDCDGLTDCDELALMSNPSQADSDDDGLPDAAEWQHGTNPARQDRLIDPDLDGAQNGDEVRRHTDPATRDPAKAPGAYQYTLTKTGNDANGAQCWKVRVENLTLAATRSGKNTILLSSSLTLDGQPQARPLVQTVRLEGTRGTALPAFTPKQVRVGCGP